MGLLLLGEKRTQDTHSEWLSSWEEKQREEEVTCGGEVEEGCSSQSKEMWQSAFPSLRILF